MCVGKANIWSQKIGVKGALAVGRVDEGKAAAFGGQLDEGEGVSEEDNAEPQQHGPSGGGDILLHAVSDPQEGVQNSLIIIFVIV